MLRLSCSVNGMSQKTPSVVLVGRPNVGKVHPLQSHHRLAPRDRGADRRERRAISLERPASWAGSAFQLVRYGRAVRRERGSAARAGRPAGTARDRRRRPAGLSGRWTRRTGPGDQTIARELRQTGHAGAARRQQDRRQTRQARPDFYQLGFEPIIRDLRRARDGRCGAAGRDRVRLESEGLRAEGQGRVTRTRPLPSALSSQPSALNDSEVAHRHRRSSERRQVVAAQSSAERRARARQRDAGHDARRDRRDADLAPTPLPHRRHGRDAAARACASGGSVELVSVAGAKKAIFDADVVALLIDSKEGATDQDAAIGGEADRAGRGVVIVANKWDLVKSQDPSSSRSSTMSCGGRCGFSTTRRSSTSPR